MNLRHTVTLSPFRVVSECRDTAIFQRIAHLRVHHRRFPLHLTFPRKVSVPFTPRRSLRNVRQVTQTYMIELPSTKKTTSYSAFVFIFFLFFFVSVPCARLSCPSRQLLKARQSTISYRIVSYDAHSRLKFRKIINI